MSRLVSEDDARKYAAERNIDLSKVPLAVWKRALEIELEHGTKYGPDTNITHNNLNKTSRIAKAHLLEADNYYQRLNKMEAKSNHNHFSSVGYSNVLLPGNKNAFPLLVQSNRELPDRKENKSQDKGRGGFGMVYAFQDTERKHGMNVVFKKMQKNWNKWAYVYLRELACGRALNGQVHMTPYLGCFFSTVIDVASEDDEGTMNYETGFVLPAACDSLRNWWMSQAGASKIKRASAEEVKDLTAVKCTVTQSRTVFLKCVWYQLLRGLHIIHMNGMLHLDIKPENILVLAEGGKVPYLMYSDFGLATMVSGIGAKYSTNVITDWYRSPELVLAVLEHETEMSYGTEQDIWSLGITFLDLVFFTQVFGSTAMSRHNRQVDRLVDLFDLKYTVDKSQGYDHHILQETQLPGADGSFQFGPKLTNLLKTHMKTFVSEKDQKNLIDLLQKMLHFDTAQRISALDGLKHAYFADDPFCQEVDRLFPVRGFAALQNMSPLYNLQIRSGALESSFVKGQWLRATPHFDVSRLVFDFYAVMSLRDSNATYKTGNSVPDSHHHSLTEIASVATRIIDLMVSSTEFESKDDLARVYAIPLFLAFSLRYGMDYDEIMLLINMPVFQGKISYSHTPKTGFFHMLFRVLTRFQGSIWVPNVYQFVYYLIDEESMMNVFDPLDLKHVKSVNYIIMAALAFSAEMDPFHSAKLCVDLLPLLGLVNYSKEHLEKGGEMRAMDLTFIQFTYEWLKERQALYVDSAFVYTQITSVVSKLAKDQQEKEQKSTQPKQPLTVKKKARKRPIVTMQVEK